MDFDDLAMRLVELMCVDEATHGALADDSQGGGEEAEAIEGGAEEGEGEDEEDDERQQGQGHGREEGGGAQGDGGAAGAPPSLLDANPGIERLQAFVTYLDGNKAVVNLTAYVVRKVLHHWWDLVGMPDYHAMMRHVRGVQGSGLRTSLDHTFKVASNLVGHPGSSEGSKSKPVRLQASVLTAITSQGLVAGIKVCPSEGHVHQAELLQEMYVPPNSTHGVMKHAPEAIYTDNYSKDVKFLVDLAASIIDARNPPGQARMDPTVIKTVIMNDIWHARMRVERLLLKNHPQYKAAVSEWRAIFSRLVSEDAAKHYSCVQELEAAILGWLEKYQLAPQPGDDAQGYNALVERVMQEVVNQPELLQEAASAVHLPRVRVPGYCGKFPNLELGALPSEQLHAHPLCEPLELDPDVTELDGTVTAWVIVEDGVRAALNDPTADHPATVRALRLRQAGLATAPALPFPLPTDVPRGTPLWLMLRIGRITPSTAVPLLGVLERSSMSVLEDMQAKFMTPRAGEHHLNSAYDTLMSRKPPVLQPSPDSHEDGVRLCNQELTRNSMPAALLTYLEWLKNNNPEGLRVHEAGVAHMGPEQLQRFNMDDLTLPPVMASPAAFLVKAGTRVGVVVVKVKSPFALRDANSGDYYYRADKCQPLGQVPVETYLECQMHMVAVGVQRCDLVSYTHKAGTAIFQLVRNDRVCSHMLRLLSKVHCTYIAPQCPPAGFRGSTRAPINDAGYADFLFDLGTAVNDATRVRDGLVASVFNKDKGTTFLDKDDGELPHGASHLLSGVQAKSRAAKSRAAPKSQGKGKAARAGPSTSAAGGDSSEAGAAAGPEAKKGIATGEKVINAVRNLTDPDLLQAMLDVQRFLDWIQGTSSNESFHSYLNRFMGVTGGQRSYQLLWVGLCMAVTTYNTNKLSKTEYGQGAMRDGVREFNNRLAEAVRRGLDTVGEAQRRWLLRRAWAAHMERSPDLETLREASSQPKLTWGRRSQQKPWRACTRALCAWSPRRSTSMSRVLSTTCSTISLSGS